MQQTLNAYVADTTGTHLFAGSERHGAVVYQFVSSICFDAETQGTIPSSRLVITLVVVRILLMFRDIIRRSVIPAQASSEPITFPFTSCEN